MLKNKSIYSVLNQKKNYKLFFFKKKVTLVKKKIYVIEFFLNLTKNFFYKSEYIKLYFLSILKYFFFYRNLGLSYNFLIYNIFFFKKNLKFFFLNKKNKSNFFYIKDKKIKLFLFLNKVSFYLNYFFYKNPDLVDELLSNKKNYEILSSFNGFSYYWDSFYYFNKKFLVTKSNSLLPLSDFWEVFEINDPNVKYRLSINETKYKTYENIYFTKFYLLEDKKAPIKSISEELNILVNNKNTSIEKKIHLKKKELEHKLKIKIIKKKQEKTKIKLEIKEDSLNQLRSKVYQSVISRHFSVFKKKKVNLKNKKKYLKKKKSLVSTVYNLKNIQNSIFIFNQIFLKNFFKVSRKCFFVILSISIKKKFFNHLFEIEKSITSILKKKKSLTKLLKESNRKFLEKFKKKVKKIPSIRFKNITKKEKIKKKFKNKLFFLFNLDNKSKLKKNLKNTFFKYKYLKININFENYIFYFFKKKRKTFFSYFNSVFFKNKRFIFKKVLKKKILKKKVVVVIKKKKKKKIKVLDNYVFFNDSYIDFCVFNNTIQVSFFEKYLLKKKGFFLYFNKVTKKYNKLLKYYNFFESRDNEKLISQKKLSSYSKNSEFKNHLLNINSLTTDTIYKQKNFFIFTSKNIFTNMKYFFSYVYDEQLLKLIFLKCNDLKWSYILSNPIRHKKNVIKFFNLKNYYLSNISNTFYLSSIFLKSLVFTDKIIKIQNFSKFFFSIILKFFKKIFFKNIVFILKKIDSDDFSNQIKNISNSIFEDNEFDNLRESYIDEFIGVSFSTFLTKDPKFLMNWIINSLSKINYKKHWKFLYNLKKNLMTIVKKFCLHTNFTGINIIIKGKIGALGSVRKKIFHIKYGSFGFSRFYLKGDELYSYAKTKTGKIGVKIVTAYS